MPERLARLADELEMLRADLRREGRYEDAAALTDPLWAISDLAARMARPAGCTLHILTRICA